MEDILGIALSPRLIGVGAGMLTSASSVPQLLKIIKEKKAEDVSVFFLLMLIAGLGLWVWYAALKHDLILLIANAFSATVNLIVLLLKQFYHYFRMKKK